MFSHFLNSDIFKFEREKKNVALKVPNDYGKLNAVINE